MSALVLSLFPGIGLLDRAFEEEGFCVVRGPDLFWGGDVKRFHPPAGKFDGIIGGPPCQKFSPLQRLVEHHRARARANGDMESYPEPEDLIPEFCRVVSEAAPQWFLMENVPEAPLPVVPGYEVQSLIYNNRWIGADQNRLRSFSFGSLDGRRIEPEQVALESPRYVPAVCASGSTWVPVRLNGSGKAKGRVYGDKSRSFLTQAIEAQGLEPETEARLLSTMTVRGAVKAVGNGVPLPMGRVIARAVAEAIA